MENPVMKFELNKNEYKIYIRDIVDSDEYIMGLTTYSSCIIEIKEGLSEVQTLRTLKHELTHVWLYEFGHNQHDENKTFSFEDVCEIVACSNDWINEMIARFKFMQGHLKEADKNGPVEE